MSSGLNFSFCPLVPLLLCLHAPTGLHLSTQTVILSDFCPGERMHSPPPQENKVLGLAPTDQLSHLATLNQSLWPEGWQCN